MSETPAPWNCPKCKADNAPDFTHCRICGEHNPAAPALHVCPTCGFKSDKDCCPSCNNPMFLNL